MLSSKFFSSALIGCFVFWCFVFQIQLPKDIYRNFLKRNNATFIKEKRIRYLLASRPSVLSEIKNFLKKSSVFEEKLILIDRKILNIYNDEGGSSDCEFCNDEKRRIITFALLSPLNGSLEEHTLSPVLKAWNESYQVESIVSSQLRKFIPAQRASNLPLGFFLQKENGYLVIEIVLFHERRGDFWWHGSFDLDTEYKSKLSKFQLLDMRKDLMLNHESLFPKFQAESVDIDGIKIVVPKNARAIIGEPNKFIECNYEQANKFRKTNPKDTSMKANQFRKAAQKILARAKAAFDELEISFWMDSGTLLGFYRECDIIPYTTDVDVGVFIWDLKDRIIVPFYERGFSLLYKFGKVSEGFELSFKMDGVKLDVFFYYDGGDHFWVGGHSKNSSTSVIQFRYKYPKFHLCWTEFLDITIRIPCETDEFIKTAYGSEWFKPIKYWDWQSDPKNVKVAGVWPEKDTNEVFQKF